MYTLIFYGSILYKMKAFLGGNQLLKNHFAICILI
jgi:hypothetical protein